MGQITSLNLALGSGSIPNGLSDLRPYAGLTNRNLEDPRVLDR